MQKFKIILGNSYFNVLGWLYFTNYIKIKVKNKISAHCHSKLSLEASKLLNMNVEWVTTTHKTPHPSSIWDISCVWIYFEFSNEQSVLKYN